MTQGTIRKLIHLCNGTDFSSTHLVSAHNGVGYGYIQSPAGDVFFDDLGLTNRRFDELKKNMPVEYNLENGANRRASSVTVIQNQGTADRQGIELIRPNEANGDDATRGEPMDAIEESSLESFPASDSPAHRVATPSRSGCARGNRNNDEESWL